MHHASPCQIAPIWFQKRSIEYSCPFLLERYLEEIHQSALVKSFRPGFVRHQNREEEEEKNGIKAYLGMLKAYTHATLMCPCLLSPVKHNDSDRVVCSRLCLPFASGLLFIPCKTASRADRPDIRHNVRTLVSLLPSYPCPLMGGARYCQTLSCSAPQKRPMIDSRHVKFDNGPGIRNNKAVHLSVKTISMPGPTSPLGSLLACLTQGLQLRHQFVPAPPLQTPQ